MPQATIRKGPPLNTACLNCGGIDGEMIAIIREDNQPGWLGCTRCWKMVLNRGQLGSVRKMIKALDLPLDTHSKRKL